MSWSTADLPDLTGTTHVVTGATAGIGRETALELARSGAQVVLAVRSTERGEHVADQIRSRISRAQHPGGVEVAHLDLADLSSVRGFADSWGERQIDVLINNAGTVTPSRRTTVDGYELTFGTNVLGPFALTNLLLPQVTDRVVVLGSIAHRSATLDLDDPSFERRRFSTAKAYPQSKLADMLWAVELDRRLRAAGSPVKALTAHPGWALTDLQRASGVPVIDEIVTAFCWPFAQGAEAGALPTLRAAVDPAPGGSVFGPDGWWQFRGAPVLVSVEPQASDAEQARALWEYAARETGTDFRA